MSRGSLRLRLLVAGAVSILIALALAAAGLSLLFARHVERRVDAELGVFLDQIVAGIDADPATGALVVSRPPSDPRFDVPLSGLYWQVTADGAVLRSRSLWDRELQLPQDALADGAVHQHVIPAPSGGTLRVLERHISLPARLDNRSVRAAVALTMSDVRAATRSFVLDLLPYLALLALFLIGAAAIQVSVGLHPLKRISARLRSIHEDPQARLGSEAFPQEIRPMASEIDDLLGARQGQIEKARSRAGDLAHGLKTPLQVLLGDVERLRADGQGAIADEIEQVAETMRRHVDRELARARMAIRPLDASSPIRQVAERVISVLSRTPRGAELEWTLEIDSDLRAAIDPDDLSEALGNLAENAVRHARSRILISGTATNDQLTICVRDDGPGISEEQIGHLMQRGTRLDQSGSGAGLGLAIVGDIAEAWDGQFALRPLSPGLEARLTLPPAKR